MKIRNEYTCPLEIVHDIIKGKWKTIILYQMKDGPLSLSELEKGIEGITQKMLLEQLNELIQFGLVEKKEFQGYPLHVEYSITEKRGKKMIEAISIMQMVGIEYMVENGMQEALIEKGIVTAEQLDSACLFKEVKDNKKRYLDLLLLADEQEDMIDRYIEKGTMYVLDDNGVKGECVVTDEGNGILEIKNIATVPGCQGKGYGKALVNFIAEKYAGKYCVLQVGTGDSPMTVPFYEKCGFVRSHCIRNFFTDNYDHPIYEGGVQLVDMIYLQRTL